MATFATVRFGKLEYAPADIITLPDGLIGMNKLRHWLLLDMDDGLPMKWFQSLDRADFGVPVMAPLYYVEDYALNLTPSIRQALRNQDEHDLVVLVITTVHAGGTMVTANLRAPLVIDSETRRGMQVALDDDQYAVRQEIDYFKFGLAVAGGTAENAGVGDRLTTDEEPVVAAAATL